MAHKKKNTAYIPATVNLTAAEITQAQTDGALPPAGVIINVIDTTGKIVSQKQSTGETTAPSLDTGGGAPGDVFEDWATGKEYAVGHKVLATVAIGAIGVGSRLRRKTAGIARAAFDATEALAWDEMVIDDDVVPKTDIVDNLTTNDATKVLSAKQGKDLQDLKAPLASPTFTGTVAGITKAMVGLGLADNVADISKPVSTAQQTALDLKASVSAPIALHSATATYAVGNTVNYNDVIYRNITAITVGEAFTASKWVPVTERLFIENTLASGSFTILSTGIYTIGHIMNFGGSGTPIAGNAIRIKVNGAQVNENLHTTTGGASTNNDTLVTKLNAGDVITFFADPANTAQKIDSGNVFIQNEAGTVEYSKLTKSGVQMLSTGNEELLVFATATTNPAGIKANKSHTHAESEVINLTTSLAAKEATANKGIANGYAPLGADLLVPAANLPTFATSLRLMTPIDILEDTDRSIFLFADDLAVGAVPVWGAFAQATVAAQPTVEAVATLGDRNAALFDSTSDFMESAANISLGTRYGLFAVIRTGNSIGGAGITMPILSEVFSGGTVEYMFGLENGKFGVGHYNGAWRNYDATSPIPAINTPYIIVAGYDGANLTIKIDGGTASTAAQTSNPTLTEANNIRLGRRWDGVAGTGLVWNGHITCVLAKRNAYFTATEISQLEGWAAWYYGRVASLPAGHAYKLAPPLITS